MTDFFKLTMQKHPLCYNLTNYVTANDCANIQLAVGASPLMSLSFEECTSLLSTATSILLNIGTINTLDWRTMHYVAYHTRKQPIILDPVGVMASDFRKKVVLDLLNSKHINVLKGNFAELSVLNGNNVLDNGIDSYQQTSLNFKCKIITKLAQRYHLLVIMSGKYDLLTDGNQIFKITGGSDLITRITGAGCMLGALLTAFCGVASQSQLLTACFCALRAWKLTAQKAATPLLGKMHTRLFDVLSTLQSNDLRENNYEILS